jgi:hypothetical protein
MTTPATTPDTKPAETRPPESAALQPAASRVPVRAGAYGLVPTTFDEVFRVANALAQSDLVPPELKNKPANVFAVIQAGAEVGVSPMQALQGSYIVNGRVSFYGDLLLGIVMKSPEYIGHVEYYLVKGERRDGLVAADWKDDDTAAVCTFQRRGHEPTTRHFSIGQARKANLLGKAGPWTTFPDRQLQMRARAFAARDGFADVLKGLSRTAEELQDLPPDETPRPAADREVREVRSSLQDFTEREADTRRAEPVSFPSPQKVADAQIVIGPLKVVAVEPFLGMFAITLADGRKIDTDDGPAALELEKVIGTDHTFSFTCTQTADGHLHLVTFHIAD